MLEYILFAVEIVLQIYLTFLLLRQKEKKLKHLIIFNVSIVVWISSVLAITRIENIELSIWFARLTFSATTIAALSYVSFFTNYIQSANYKVPKIIKISGIIIAFLAQTPFLVKDLVKADNSNYPSVVFGNLAIIYILFIIVSVVFLLNLIRKSRKTIQGLEYLQLSYITTGMIIASIIAVLTNLIVPIITNDSTSAFWGPVAISIISVITTYTVTRHRLFGLKYIFNRILYFVILITIPFIFFSILLNILPISNLDGANPITYLIGVITSIIFILIYYVVKNFLDRKLSPKLESNKKDINIIRDNFLKKISTELDIDMLGATTLDVINQIFDLHKSGVIIFNSSDGSVIYKRLSKFMNIPINNHNLIQVIKYWDKLGHSTTITKDELLNLQSLDNYQNEILDFMQNEDIEIILPLNKKVHLNGIIILGRKNNQNPFTIEDINYLESLIINSSVAFSRSILYSQVQELNDSLQQKVDEQTKELIEKVKQLQEARRKEADMIDIMGHELRTPMSIVKLNADLLHNFTENVPTRREDYVKYVSRIKDAVDTEIKLINTLLSSAKLEGNKIELNLEKVNIIDQIKMAVHAQEKRAQEKGIQLITNYDKKGCFVYADHARTVEIINNLMDNAVKYTEKGSITITTKDLDKFIEISIQDTGEGMTKSDIARLGQKFFRTGNYITSEKSDDFDIVRPGGTGLGLYVTFSLIKKMGGEIKVDSELGKGSTFTFTLQKYDGQTIEKKHDTQDMFERMGLKQ
ncbi:MAG: ATP-binding protein [Candidatus Dojkabacteria bacterium]|nr:ATP-binding protein [Candidatus Dojkabacteria bacterium]